MIVPTPHAQFRQNVAQGIMFMCLAILIMPVMNGMAKSLTVDHPVAMVVWARFTGHLVAMTLVFWPSRGWRLFKTARPAVQLAGPPSCSSRTDAISARYPSSRSRQHPPLCLPPLDRDRAVCPFLGERVGIRRWTAVIVGFLGALIIIRPGLDTPGFDATGPGLVLLLVPRLALRYVDIDPKTFDRDSAETMIVYMPLTGAIAMSCAMPFVGVIPEGWSN